VYKRILVVSCLFVVLTSLLSAPTVNALPYTDITAETAYQMITSGAYPNLVILDVRTREEFDTGHIRKAILIPHTELEQRIDELAEHKDHEIIVYCRLGGRSATASGILDAHNFSKVYNMLGGIEAWKAQGYPVTTSYLTYIFLSLTPNPAKTGQTIFLRGILIDQFSNPVANETVKLYYRNSPSLWYFALALKTNKYGIFVAAGSVQKSGLYQICAYYPGSLAYEASYEFAILIVQT